MGVAGSVAMRVLVYGAGVIGSLYAARLKEAGSEVTVLARGARLEWIHKHGIELQDVATGARSSTRVATIDRLAPDAPYDLVLVPVRVDQLESVFPSLAASHATPNVLFFGNDARGPSAQIAALGRARVMLGFAGAGGCIDGGVVGGYGETDPMRP